MACCFVNVLAKQYRSCSWEYSINLHADGASTAIGTDGKVCMVLQTLGIAEIPLVDADFIVNPRKVVHFDTAFFKPEAHGHLLKLSKVRHLQHRFL